MAIVETSKFQKPKREEYAPKLREIQIGLKNVLVNLRSKLNLLEPELKSFSDLENLKIYNESRACNLELEVEDLKEELKAIKSILDLDLKKKSSMD
jgi:hypothetical protein